MSENEQLSEVVTDETALSSNVDTDVQDPSTTNQVTAVNGEINGAGINAQEVTTEQVNADEHPSGRCHTGNVCIKLKTGIESSAFSFTLGCIFFAAGITLAGVYALEHDGKFLFPAAICIAAGAIILLRGCVNELSKRQQRQQEAEEVEREQRRRLTRAERSQLADQRAVCIENLLVPPNYEDQVPRRGIGVDVGSQANFGDQSLEIERPSVNAITSVQSQTQWSLPSTQSIAVDTSDLPLDTTDSVGPPPSYDKALSPHASAINIYLEDDEDNDSDAGERNQQELAADR